MQPGRKMASATRFFIFLIFVKCSTSFHIEGEDCERDKSRIVRDVIYEELLLLYKSAGAKVPYRCPFFKDRDRFRAQEEQKEKETNARWACNYCGKIFIGEVYLDMHMANRHATNLYKEEDSVCLADYCEIFRCDVLAGVAKPTFWDLALCMEEDMQDLAQDCKDLMSSCVPDSLNWNASKALAGALSDAVCSYLTCKKYFDAPVLEEKEPPRVSYVVLTIALSAAIIVYYCVAVNFFWLDTFADIYDQDEYVGRGPDSLFDPDNLTTMEQMAKPKKKTFIQSDYKKDRDIFNMKKMEGLQGSVKRARNVVSQQHRHAAQVENVPSASSTTKAANESFDLTSSRSDQPVGNGGMMSDITSDLLNRPGGGAESVEDSVAFQDHVRYETFGEGDSSIQMDNSVFVDER